MAKILVSTIISNDLGPVMRMLPIAKILRHEGFEVIFCNRAKAPSQVIEENGFENRPVAPSLKPQVWPEKFTPEIWNGSQGVAYEGFLDPDYVRDLIHTFVQLMDEVQPDLVLDSWNQSACIAARYRKIPLVTINQADLHPLSQGLIWWKSPPDDLPDPVPVVNKLLAELDLPRIRKIEEMYLGDLNLVVGIPETDPLPEEADVTYIGSLQELSKKDELPDHIQAIDRQRPVIWVYSGNPRYGSAPFIADSIVIIRAAVAVLGEMDVKVVLSTGYQPLPEEFKSLPDNFFYESFVPGFAMAQKADLFIHHGGHGSTLTGLSAGTPALIVPTYSERESNARRVARLGAGEFVLPSSDEQGEKHISLGEFKEKVELILADKRYLKAVQKISARLGEYEGPQLAADLIKQFMVDRDLVD